MDPWDQQEIRQVYYRNVVDLEEYIGLESNYGEGS